MSELLGYISSDVARHGREIARIQSALYKQRNLNFLASLLIFSFIAKYATMNKRIKALEAASEGESK